MMSNSEARKRMGESPDTQAEAVLRCAMDGEPVEQIPCGGRCHSGCIAQLSTEPDGEACTCPPDEFLSPSDCALHGDHLPNQFSNGEELGVPDNLAAALRAEGGGDRVGETLGPVPDDTSPHGLDWRGGLDALDALLDDCSQVGADHENFVRVQAVRHIVNAVRRYEDDTDETIRSAIWEDAVTEGEPWAMTDQEPTP